MNGDQPIAWLMFFTLAAAIIVAAGGFLFFLRSQRNRDIAADALAGDGSRAGTTPSGAMPELAAVAVVALVAMGLLATGYASKSTAETAEVSTPVGTTGMAQDPGSADRPKPYQPANPAPDLRVAPTGSDAGKTTGTTR
jgi:hypothetical protein